jgi:cytochrome c551/c552
MRSGRRQSADSLASRQKAVWIHKGNCVIAHLPDGQVVGSVTQAVDGTYTGKTANWLKKEQAIADWQRANPDYDWS